MLSWCCSRGIPHNLDDSLKDRLQDANGLGTRQLVVQFREELLRRVVRARQFVEPTGNAAMKDRTKFAIKKSGSE